ncbi:translocation/assembly module TamB domain-containing protein [Catalinimonas niigatensis]|uniref:translocation/assembly module TamB domain-containing protein n=1 Tax=Catalinimonas niigatensis TaxID=1397264 RepID=UPI002664FBC5|nr:translocation/assembly module TamB domain-containing protein [Catalinimonas niigatensis]WPP50235.1 translocation/assembly module TamB domain-containing protein [Catalinimonas niigatensis]
MLVATVQIPYIQTRIVHKLAQTITEKTGFQTSIKKVNIKWFDTIVLDSIAVIDDDKIPMIQVSEIAIDFDIRTLIDGRNIYLSEAHIQGGEVNLTKSPVDSTLNMTRFIDNVRSIFKKRGTPKSKAPPVFTISDVHLREMKFSYSDLERPPITTAFDYNHFELEKINGDVKNFRVVADTLELMVNRLRCYEPVNDFTIHDFTGFYQYTNQSMTFRDFDLYAGNSTVRDSVVFHYDSKADLSYFNDSVTINASIKQTEIHSRDLALFAPYLQRFDEFYTISGEFDGLVRNFTVKDFILDYGARSHMAGEVSFDGLPDFKETFIDLNLKEALIDTKDLEQYIDDQESFRTIRKFGDIYINGQFLGFPNDFVANGNAQTALGKIVSDINLKIEDKPIYAGSLALTDFDLSAFSPEPGLFQKTTFNGTINGNGLNVDDADFQLDAKFKYLGVNHYRYKNISTNAHFAKSFFEGKLNIADPNLKFSLNGTVDLRDGKEDIVLEAQLDTAFLKPLKLTEEDIFFSTSLVTNTKGFKIDDLVGDASFSELFVSYQGRNLAVDTLSFESIKSEEERSFKLHSDKFNASLTGKYDFSYLIKDVEELAKEYALIFTNDAEELKAYYSNKKVNSIASYEEQKYELNYEFYLEDFNPVLQLFAPQMSVSYNTLLEGKFTGGYTNIITLHSKIDSIKYDNSLLLDNKIDISTSKITDSTQVLAMVYLESDRQEIDKDELNLTTEDFIFEAIWSDDHIDFQQSIQQENTTNHANLSGELWFLKDTTEIQFHPSDLLVLDHSWFFSDSNKVIITNNEISFSQFALFNQSNEEGMQEISIFGGLSDQPEKTLTLKINHFQVDNLNPLLKRNYQGEVNGFLDIQNIFSADQDSTRQLVLDSEFSIQNFSINNFKVGNIISLADWDNTAKEMRLNLMVNGNGKRIISLNGGYKPQAEVEQLNLKAFFQDANINILEPYFDDYFSEFGGTADGNFTISGTLQYPILLGQGDIQNGSIKINYLNTSYSFDGGIFFDENTIGVKDLTLFDPRNNIAVFNGGIFHDGFTNYVIDLSGSLDNVAVLNTTLKDNDLFYGKGYATGEVSLLGAIENMNITARVRTEKGTKIFIPIESVEDAQQSEFISFVNHQDSVDEVALTDKIDVKGVNLDLEIDITPDAYGELIFDIKTGDIIRGRGEGQLQLLLSSAGEFSMFGDISFLEGGYNFTLYNIINKEFQIQPGSTISWLGDPYGGIVDIDATYQQLASLEPLVLNPEARDNDEVRRRYDAIVYMNLTGDLMTPDIDFKIDVQNYPENNIYLQTAVETLKNSALYGEEETKRQVFSLIVLRRFSEIGSFEGGGNLVSSSVSELLSNQFSYWLSQVDENLVIDVDLGSFDEDRFNTFQLRLSYTFLDGRLRVTRDGGFTNVNNEADAASVIGDVTVEYLLTQNGKLRAKVYNRNTYNSLLNSIGAGNNTTQGISLMHVESFDKVRELFNAARTKGIEEKNRNTNNQQVQDSTKLEPTGNLPLAPLKQGEELIPE